MAIKNTSKALAICGGLYALGAAWMATNYYNKSSLKKIYVKADPAYEKVKVGHAPGVNA